MHARDPGNGFGFTCILFRCYGITSLVLCKYVLPNYLPLSLSSLGTGGQMKSGRAGA
jgi:hypothetical protein